MNEVVDGIWVGDIVDVREESTNHFETIITVCQDSVEDNISAEQEYHFFCMADGPLSADAYGGSYEYEMFEEAVNAVLAAEQPVLVHCHMGQSRSVAVVTAAVAVMESMNWYDAFEQVRRYRPQAHPDGMLVENAQRYIEEYN